MASPTRSPHRRFQSDTRMDVLSSLKGAKAKVKNDNSPRDSLSPCDEYFEKESGEQDRTRTISEKRSDIAITITGPDSEPSFEDGNLHSRAGLTTQAGTPRAQAKQERTCSKISFRDPFPEHKQTTPALGRRPQQACPPRFRVRSHRPSALYIDSGYGLTTVPINELKHSIRGAGPGEATNTTLDHKPLPSPPPRPRRRLPKSPPPPPPRTISRERSAKMGNQHSHHSITDESALDDSRSVNSVIRSPRTKAGKVPRRSSINVFKRLDSKSPLPTDFTATVIEVPRAATAPNLDGMGDDDIEDGEDEQERGRAQHLHRHSAPSPSLPVRSPSPATLTEEIAARPESAVDTITDHRACINEMGNEESSPSHLRVSALSPTLPTPSPLPEDSPHKYGLKDRMDTPEMPSPPDLKVAKAKRRSSGLEIFNEAKSLQSAASFLNGLSTARRRAESRAQSRNATDSTTATTAATTTSYGSTFPSLSHLPLSTNPSTVQLSHPSAASASQLQLLTDVEEDLVDRNRGHTTKSSGFAYARPLNITQLKCYRSHNRLLPSKNKNVPVECAVCHLDDEKDYFACSWCALRMCRFCRRDFHERGEVALRERVRMAEMGNTGAEIEAPIVSGRASAAGLVRVHG